MNLLSSIANFLEAALSVKQPSVHMLTFKFSYLHGFQITTVWPEILAGNLFWRIGCFESNLPIFHPPNKLQSVMSSLLRNHSLCVYTRPAARRASLNSQHGVHH